MKSLDYFFNRFSYVLTFLNLLFGVYFVQADPDSLKLPQPQDSLLEIQVNAVVDAFRIQKAINEQNDREGKSYLNNYIIFPEYPYLKGKWDNGGEQLWNLGGIKKIADYLLEENEKRTDAPKHYVIIASIYNYYYDVAYYDLDLEEGYEEGSLLGKDLNWKDLQDGKNLLEVDEELKNEYLNLANANVKVRSNHKIEFIKALKQKLLGSSDEFEDEDFVDISVIITFYEWEFNGESNTPEYVVADYYLNIIPQSGGRNAPSNSYITKGFETFQEIQEEEASREDKVLALIKLTVEYFQIIEEKDDEGTLEDVVTSEQGKHLVGVLLGWAARDGVKIDEVVDAWFDEKIRLLGQKVDERILERLDPNLTREESTRLQWALYLGFLEAQYDLTFDYALDLNTGKPEEKYLPPMRLDQQDAEPTTVLASSVDKSLTNIDEYYDHFEEVITKINASRPLFDTELSKLKTGHWRGFTVTERIKLIDNILNNGLSDEKKANYLSLLFKGTSKFQSKKLIEELEKKGRTLQKMLDLYGEFYYFGQDDLKQPANELFKLWERGYSFDEIISLGKNLPETRIFKYKGFETNLKFFILPYIEDVSTDIKISDKGEIKIKISGAELYILPATMVQAYKVKDQKVLESFEPIGLLSRGGITTVPAFYYAWMLKTQKNDKIIAEINFVIEAAAFVIGVGELMAAKRAVEVAWALAEIAPVASDWALNLGLAEYIEKNITGGKELVRDWRILNKSIEAITIVKGIDDITKSFVDKMGKQGKVLDELEEFARKNPEAAEDVERMRDFHNVLVKALRVGKYREEIVVNIGILAKRNIPIDKIDEAFLWVNKNDKFIDIIVHGENGKFFIKVEGKPSTPITGDDLAKFIKENNLIEEGKTIRLLSCADLKAAQDLSKGLVGQEVIATNDIVKIYEDGGVITLSRKTGNETQNTWNSFKNGEQIENVPNIEVGNRTGKFLKMGNDIWDDAMIKASSDPNKVHHILQSHHDWDKVVDDANNWSEVKVIIEDVLRNGTQGTYKSVSNKTKTINGETVEVVFKEINDKIYISDAWVKD